MQNSKYSLLLLCILVIIFSLFSGLTSSTIIEKEQSNATSQEHIVTNNTYMQPMHVTIDTNMKVPVQSTFHTAYKVTEKGSFSTSQKADLYQASTIGAGILSLIYQLPLQDCTFTMSYLQTSGLLNGASIGVGEVSSSDSMKYEFMVNANSFELISLYHLKETYHKQLPLSIPYFSQESLTRIAQELQVLQNYQYIIQTLNTEITTYTKQMTDLSMKMGLKGLDLIGKTPKEMEQIAQEMESTAAQMEDVGNQMINLMSNLII